MCVLDVCHRYTFHLYRHFSFNKDTFPWSATLPGTRPHELAEFICQEIMLSELLEMRCGKSSSTAVIEENPMEMRKTPALGAALYCRCLDWSH